MKTITEEKEKIGIGARRLSETEIRKILPTYDTLLKQIEGFKQTGSQYTKDTLKEESKEQGIFGLPQVTNNISIIGPRGAGKTSVMKSLFYELSKKDSNGNVSHILLPPIVPENMPDSMDLLSNILGLLGKRVGECTEKEKKERESSLCFYEKPELECLYEEVVQYFGYLKSDYKEQVKKENLTESSHIDKNIKLFTSNYKFVEVFYQFIYKLLEYEKKELLFLFIDDVDLSTYRCMDIVQTLLSYISHPRIVTILSGDLDTFEEALTLEFLRQEKMPDSSSFDNNYIRDGKGESDTLIRRKNILAYEYLKKIMPPLYRHRIAEWGLEKRGEFIVGGDIDKGDNDSNTTLLDLLEGLEVYNKEKLKNYFAISTDNGKKIIPQMFHIFDNVARGLNNVAHVLKQKPNIEEGKAGNQGEDNENNKKQEYLYKKTILETVLFSNKILNANREVILNDVLVLGEDEDSTYISFENLYSVFAIDEVEKIYLNSQTTEVYESVAKNYVTIFLYCDWGCRLLNFYSILKTVEYNKAKKEALIYLLLYPTMSGKTKVFTEKFSSIYFMANDIDENDDCIYKDMIQSYFLFDFQQAVAFLEYCDILECYEKIVLSQEKVDKEKEIILYIKFYRFLTSYCEKNAKGMYDISIYLQVHTSIIQKIEEVFYIDGNRTLIRELVREFYFEKTKSKINLYNIYKRYIDIGYRKYYLLQNLSHGKYIYDELREYFKVNICEDDLTRDILWNKIEESNTEKQITYRVKNEEASKYISNRFDHEKTFYNYFYYLIFEKYGNDEYNISDILLKEPKTKGDELKRCKVIIAINENKIWNDVLSEEIIKYIAKKIESYEKKLVEKFKHQFQIHYDSNVVEKIKSIINNSSFDRYLNEPPTFKEVNTIWGQCQILIGKILKIEKDNPNIEQKYNISLYSYILLIDVLSRIIYSSAWTGIKEAWEIRQWLETGIWDIEGAIENEANEKGKSEVEELLELYRFYLLAYCKIQVEQMNPELWKHLSSAKECLDSIEYSRNKLADEKGEEYRKKLNLELEVDGESMSFDDIQKLFS